MLKSKTTTTIIIVIVVLIAAYWAYGRFFGASEIEPAGVTVTSGTIAVPSDNSTASQLVRVLSDVDKTTLNNRSIFSNPIFKDQLKDFGKIIADRPLGRSNPFAPIGSGVAVVSQSTGGAAAGASTNTNTDNAPTGNEEDNIGDEGGGDARLDILGE